MQLVKLVTVPAQSSVVLYVHFRPRPLALGAATHDPQGREIKRAEVGAFLAVLSIARRGRGVPRLMARHRCHVCWMTPAAAVHSRLVKDYQRTFTVHAVCREADLDVRPTAILFRGGFRPAAWPLNAHIAQPNPARVARSHPVHRPCRVVLGRGPCPSVL